LASSEAWFPRRCVSSGLNQAELRSRLSSAVCLCGRRQLQEYKILTNEVREKGI